MSEEEDTPVLLPPHPTESDPEALKVYWGAQGEPWRTEPEIDQQRQTELAQRRAIAPVIEQGMYPFQGMKQSRADIEWLLATHENGHGPVDWQDMRQRTLEGLDLRGVDLRNVDLHKLPLARTKTGLKWLANLSEWLHTTAELLQAARIHLEGADLREARERGSHFMLLVCLCENWVSYSVLFPAIRSIVYDRDLSNKRRYPVLTCTHIS